MARKKKQQTEVIEETPVIEVIEETPKTPETKGPETKAKTTFQIFSYMMAALRNATIPVKYSKVGKDNKYFEPLQGRYQNDGLDPYESAGVEYWVLVQDYATRYPVSDPSATWTATGCTVAGNGVNFTVTIDDSTANPNIVYSLPLGQEGWGVIRAKVKTNGNTIVTSTTGGENIPIAGGIYRVFEPSLDAGWTTIVIPMYLSGTDAPSFTFNGENGDVVEFKDFEFYLVKHNIS